MQQKILFTAKWCKPCKELKQWLIDKGVDFDLIHVDVDEEPTVSKTAKVKVVPSLLANGTLYGGREEIKPYLEALIK